MTIKIAPREDCIPLNELDPTESFPIAPEFARELVKNMGMGADSDGTAMFFGKVWDNPEDDIDYPSSAFDIRVRDGRAICTCEVPYAKGLLVAWAEEFVQQPMIMQIPMR